MLGSLAGRIEERQRGDRRAHLLPLVVYVGVTVVAPAVSGAAQARGFWEHAGITVAIPALATWVWLAVAARGREREDKPGTR